MELIIYKNIPCPVLLKKESDTFLILFKDEQKWIYKCFESYGEIHKIKTGIYYIFNGEFYRENGPAIEKKDGTKEWFTNNDSLRHRLDGPAIEYYDGTKFWYKNGKRHREDGPAVEFINGHKEWWINEKLHRLDGPAIEYFDGLKEYWIEGKNYFEKEFLEKIEEMKRDGTYII